MKKIALSIVVVIAAWIGLTKMYRAYRYHPRVNSHPRYFLTVKGRIDPALFKTVKLTWIASYDTSNPACKVDINWFEGISSPRIKQRIVQVHPNKQGYFLDKIPLDYYWPGFCQWQARAIEYKTKNGTTSVGFFSKKAKGPFKQSAFSHWRCIKTDCRQTSVSALQANTLNGNILSNRKNYNFTLTFTKG
jgi:hypothetical protein